MIYRLTNQLGDEVLATDREISENTLIPLEARIEILELGPEGYTELADEYETVTVERIA